MAINFLNTVAVDENVLFVDTTNDRVGIKTVSPDRALQVGDGTADDSIRVLYSDASYTRLHGYGLYMSRTASYIRPVTSGTQTLFIGNSSNTWNATVHNANTHYFQKGTNEWMRITPSGNVGIGTTSPLVELEVDGNIMASGSTGGALRLNTNSLSNSGVRNSILSTTQNGLAPPQGELKWEAGQYGGASVWTTRLHNAPYTTSYINLPHSSTGGNFVVNIESVDRLTIDRANGNVGIGTTSPGAKLDIVGSILGIRVKQANLSDVLRVYTQGSGIFMDNGNVHISDDLKVGSTLISNQENTDIDSAAAEVVAQVAHATYTAAFFDFVVKKGTNVRSGTVYACHNGDTTPLVEFTETSTQDLGDTSDVVLSVDISGANMRLMATVASDDWSVKSLVKAI